MKYQKGFTVVELISVAILVFAAGALFLFQKRDLEVSHQDSQRKSSVNAIYYHLEDIYYKTNASYPQQLSTELLSGIDPDTLNDPAGIAINESASTLRYEPTNCNEGKCASYTLRAQLEKEADYIKRSKNN